ncbi:MAG: class I adenylate cyclase [Thiotrichaceae bacterium]|nr:class I adenylate cyclase [Thiotrichaceae bacterium]
MPGDSALDIKTIKKRFLGLNRERIRRTRDVLRTRQRDVMDVLTLLFHANHPSFPGYISKNTPVGVADYQPSKTTLDAAKKLVRSFDYKKKALPRYDIHSMFLMGSSGTIAYSENSDFDIWLCHRSDLAGPQLDELQQKAEAIEKWADEFGLEVHFFLMDAEKFKEGRVVELSVESSGSAQHHLLLEEFYRTGLLLAGRYPVWWLVPPHEEKNYDAYVDRLKLRRDIRDSETIDFGGLPDAPAEEFLGAALWQLYKGVDSPYKAVLKLMLMETYASEYPHVRLLCTQFKQEIHDGEIDMVSLDPYIMLYKKLANYLSGPEQEEKLELVRRCFYFKVNEQLGKSVDEKYMTWQREVMGDLTASWSWTQTYMAMLDTRAEWKINRVIDERRSLVGALTQGYQFLSQFAREHVQLSMISQRDLHILGRKLYAAFERKAGKIDIINRGVSDDVVESHLTFYRAGDDGGWMLFRGNVGSEEMRDHKPLKRAHSVVELTAWCFFNKLADDRTVVVLQGKETHINMNEVRAINRVLDNLFPGGKLIASSMEDLTDTPRMIRAALLVNVADEVMDMHVRDGKHMTSNRTDALSYGGVCNNLINSFDFVFQTSWQEVLTFRYTGPKGVLDCLRAYVQWIPRSKGVQPPAVKIQCDASGRAMVIQKRIEELFEDVTSCFYSGSNPETVRYLFCIGRVYYLLQIENDALAYTQHETFNDMLNKLSEPSENFTTVAVDRYALKNTLMPMVFRLNKEGVIQVFYQLDGHFVDVYVVDENGSLYYQRAEDQNPEVLLNQYRRFFDSVTYRQMIQRGDSPIGSDKEDASKIQFFQAVRGRDRRLILQRKTIESNVAAGGYFNLQVIGEDVGDGKSMFTIYCNDVEMTSLEFGDGLFSEVARHVLQQRKSGLLYPIYITDIDIPATLLGMDSSRNTQTINYLNYKRFIEAKLNTELKAIASRTNSPDQVA